GVARAADPQRWFEAELAVIQPQLFTLGAELATVDARLLGKMPRIGEDDVTRFEHWIDRMEAELPPLKNFVLPTGSGLAAQLHVARTICRRAERRTITLSAHEPVDGPVVKYLNRLSDLLFVMARLANRRAAVPEVEWKPESTGG